VMVRHRRGDPRSKWNGGYAASVARQVVQQPIEIGLVLKVIIFGVRIALQHRRVASDQLRLNVALLDPSRQDIVIFACPSDCFEDTIHGGKRLAKQYLLIVY
jgi:hypothetical protein